MKTDHIAVKVSLFVIIIDILFKKLLFCPLIRMKFNFVLYNYHTSILLLLFQ